MNDANLPHGMQYEPVILTPKQFEIEVEKLLINLGSGKLAEFKTNRLENLQGRDLVQILHDRLRAVGAQKGMLFATTRFQRGAIEFAKQRGIALVQVADGKTSYFTKGLGKTIYPPDLPPYVGWFITLNDEGNELHSRIMADNPHNIFA